MFFPFFGRVLPAFRCEKGFAGLSVFTMPGGWMSIKIYRLLIDFRLSIVYDSIARYGIPIWAAGQAPASRRYYFLMKEV